MKEKSWAIAVGVLVVGSLCLGVGLWAYFYLNATHRQAMQPSLEIISPSPNETANVRKDIAVQVRATAQGSPVTLLQFYADGYLAGEQRGPADEILGTWNWAATLDGVHTLSFLAYNQEGDASLASVQVTAIASADRDTDHIPDEQDACPDQAGPEASRGCTLPDDRDQDGIPDAQDACPDKPGEPADAGCPPVSVPDRDRDGVPDAADRCPDQPGLPEWDGCPAVAWVADRDGDGLPDFMDTCPEEAGVVESEGCPAVVSHDSDGDGVSDDVDACPDQVGPPSNAGCPIIEDRDGDGIPDAADACPDEAGLEESDGCLREEGFSDADGDGVIDGVDLCVSEAGPIENDGCPMPEDRDADGVPDADDNCPESAGPAANRGCPYIIFHLPESLLGPALSLNPCDVAPSLCDPDGDGLRSDADDCPEQAGPPEHNGCPIFPQDQDGDGVLDEYDECDAQAGDPANLGCPDPSDLDRDGIPLALDACPEQAGPSSNHGCPRADRTVNVEIEVLALNTDPSWIGTYCYVKATGLALIVRVPESGLMGGSGGSWNLPRDRRSVTAPLSEDGAISTEVLCWGYPADPAILPQSLGTVIRSHGYEDWDNQLRQARGEGSGGWFEIVYHLCRDSCP